MTLDYGNNDLSMIYSYTMQSYGGYINYLRDWWWPAEPQQQPKSPLEQLRTHLLHSGVQFVTKHSTSNIVVERICMMYTALVSGPGSQFDSFRSSIQAPLQFTTSNTAGSQNYLNEHIPSHLVSLKGHIKVKKQKINYCLKVSVVLHPMIQFELPWVFVENDWAECMQPNPAYKQLYYGTVGGVQINPSVLVTADSNRGKVVDWQNYRQQNLSMLMKNVSTLLHESFPYAKRFITWQEEQKLISKDGCMLKLVAGLRQHFQGVLANVQQLTILKASIQSQTSMLQHSNQQLQQLMEQQQGRVTPSIEVTENQLILQLLAQKRAYNDCLSLLESRFQSKDLSYDKTVEMYRQMCSRSFESTFKLHKAIQQAKSSQHT